MIKKVLLFCGLFALPLSAFDKAQQVSLDDIDSFQISLNGVTLSNFLIKEEKALLPNGLHNLKVSYAARNTNDDTKALVVMLVGKQEDEILWALNVNPMFFLLASKGNETCEGDIYVPPGDLKKTTKIWIRVVGDF
jgi:hypothetical protein